jgi:hypothetical protein
MNKVTDNKKPNNDEFIGAGSGGIIGGGSSNRDKNPGMNKEE